MPRLKYKKKGKRVNIWIPDRQMQRAKDIDNLSNFIQIALDNAIDIMTWALLKKYDPKKYNIVRQETDEEIFDEFNKNYPTNELTAKRLNKEWHKPSQKLPDVLL